jgi:hypothetical protein
VSGPPVLACSGRRAGRAASAMIAAISAAVNRRCLPNIRDGTARSPARRRNHDSRTDNNSAASAGVNARSAVSLTITGFTGMISCRASIPYGCQGGGVHTGTTHRRHTRWTATTVPAGTATHLRPAHAAARRALGQASIRDKRRAGRSIIGMERPRLDR